MEEKKRGRKPKVRTEEAKNEPNPNVVEAKRREGQLTRIEALRLACSCVKEFHETSGVIDLAKVFEGYLRGEA